MKALLARATPRHPCRFRQLALRFLNSQAPPPKHKPLPHDFEQRRMPSTCQLVDATVAIRLLAIAGSSVGSMLQTSLCDP
eukprot:CAMPEP_0203950876 /NCGR_PEP_ID=MMETSP0359-20131031/84898_1 /ASSEMBLY_ACC=CAM_ASM_000338 /TAXON_ID=268821 /ORGANISM="Scrippsiella Hangoei, Strain SHTV-5" /LENGTH=79 /DNA_ID=CAMNT_0050883255 /DNA_START=537 /DNA_END=776 /DNA_ORIENTATION=+